MRNDYDQFFLKTEVVLNDLGYLRGRDYQGLSIPEIEAYLSCIRVEHVPYTYFRFLEIYGMSRNKFYWGQIKNKNGLDFSMQTVDSILSRSDYSLPKDSLVFAEWQGYRFHYLTIESDNPEVFHVFEPPLENRVPFVEKFDSLTFWISNMLLSSIWCDFGNNVDLMGSVTKMINNIASEFSEAKREVISGNLP